MNLKLADLNEELSMANDKYVNSIVTFNQILERDFGTIKDAIMKYFIYQTSFLKNTEYDANNIIAVRPINDSGTRRRQFIDTADTHVH
jgi:hypothetical protein